MRILVLVLSLLMLQGCTMFGTISVEQPTYHSKLAEKPFEIREYGSLVLVQTTVDSSFEDAQDEAFGRLFRYISGSNIIEEKVEMTAPVTMQSVHEEDFSWSKGMDGWVMSFVLPSKFTIETAPKPKSPKVRLVEIPAKRVAVKTFSGLWDTEDFEQHSADLKEWVGAKNLEVTSVPRIAGYNPPWTLPFLRTNEIHIDVR